MIANCSRCAAQLTKSGPLCQGLPQDARAVAGRYNNEYERFEIAVESASFPEVIPGDVLERFDVHVTRASEMAESLLREVHDNSLNGFLYSGPVRRRVAEFLGMPDVKSSDSKATCELVTAK